MQSLAKEEHPQGRLESRLSDSRRAKWLQACRARQNQGLGPVLTTGEAPALHHQRKPARSDEDLAQPKINKIKSRKAVTHVLKLLNF